jgi:hypothetical protein
VSGISLLCPSREHCRLNGGCIGTLGCPGAFPGSFTEVPASAKIIPFTGITKLDLPPDRMLENNIGLLAGVVIMGWDHEGNEVFASSYADGGTVLWLLERCKMKLMEAPDA